MLVQVTNLYSTVFLCHSSKVGLLVYFVPLLSVSQELNSVLQQKYSLSYCLAVMFVGHIVISFH